MSDRPTYAKLCSALRNDRRRARILGDAGEIWFCEMRQSPMLGDAPLSDLHISRIREHVGASADDVHRALVAVAQEHRRHPVADYLRRLEWDGKPRLDRLVEHLSTAPSDLERVLCRRWAIAAVARALAPGSKVDTMLVLVGDQGFLKSTFFCSLAGPQWFSDTALDLGNKDALMAMRAAWIIEFAELETIKRARDAAAVKSFLSSSEDVYRSPYGRTICRYPRTSILVGTTNDKRFLSDASGNRRYWPVKVDRRIDIEAVAAVRNQIWPEAVTAYERKEPWWLTPEEDAELAVGNRAHELQDPWADLVIAFADKQDRGTSVAAILEHALEKPPGTWSRADEMRVTAILRRDGFIEGGRRAENGQVVRVWRRPTSTDLGCEVGRQT